MKSKKIEKKGVKRDTLPLRKRTDEEKGKIFIVSERKYVDRSEC